VGFPDRIERVVQVAHPPEKARPALTAGEGRAGRSGDEPRSTGARAGDIVADHGFTTSFTTARPAAMAAVLAGTIGLAVASWIVAVWQMRGMDMGMATRLGSFAAFIAVWVVMMAAMMLPAAAPAVLRCAQASGGVRAVPLFIGSYLAVWALVGAAVYALYRPHGPVAAGVVVIVAGGYEFTPFKRHFRRRCRDYVRSGFQFGLCCAGSSIGLMAMLVALGVMSVTWMSVIAVLVLAQKLLPAKTAIDLPLALAISGLGALIVITPSLVPGLSPPM
jgi:predicted metal-binding membrane protein